MQRKLFIWILFYLIAGSVTAQEVLLNLDYNTQKKASSSPTLKTKNLVTLPLQLPFFDDFHYPGPYPDNRLWQDSFAFVNSSFALFPKTNGTATFDALNQKGHIYDAAYQSKGHFVADLLTSHPIRLDSVFSPIPLKLNPADSLILSFYYQPQGRGNAPREKDSLVLEFLLQPGYFAENPEQPDQPIWIDDLWQSVWNTKGSTYKNFSNSGHPPFQRVMISIDHEKWLRKDFRFRFKSYAGFPLDKSPLNYGGNIAIWNIDYVYMNYGRSQADTVYYDIAFAAPAQSILKYYTAMPWSHYIYSPHLHLKTSFSNDITNLDKTNYNYTYRYSIQDEQGNSRNYSGGSWNIAPHSTSGYQTYAPHANPIVISNPLQPTSPAPARTFKITHILREGTTGDARPGNDTIVYQQVFGNYFAYDDGIPESGYGLIGFNAKGAYRFNLSHPDVIKGVQLYLNPTIGNRNLQPFYIKIWKNLVPEELLYQSELIIPNAETHTGQFFTHILSQEVMAQGAVYIGWQQTNSEFLNIGFDFNNDARENLFYNTSGQWEASIFSGALMIRPLVGELSTHVPADISPAATPRVFPNPSTSGRLQINADPHTNIHSMMILDPMGRVLLEQNFSPSLELSALPNGLYFIRFLSLDGKVIHTSRFIIAKP